MNQHLRAVMVGVYGTLGFFLGGSPDQDRQRRRPDQRGMSTIELAVLIGVVLVVVGLLVVVITTVAAKYTAKIK